MRRLAIVALIGLGLALAGCSGGNNSDDDRYRGFYGGVSGGMTTSP